MIKMKDVSSYKVVFDDLDEKIIKRGSLCIKGEIKIKEYQNLKIFQSKVFVQKEFIFILRSATFRRFCDA